MAAKELKTSWQKVIGVSVIGSLVICLIAVAFMWPAKTAQPHQIPIAITGNSQQVAVIKKSLETKAGDRVRLIPVTDREEAVDQIKNREVYGAIIIAIPNAEVLTASANGAALNAVITAMSATLQTNLTNIMASRLSAGAQAPQTSLKTTDIVSTPNAAFDLAQLALPLAISGIIGGVLIAGFLYGRLQRVTALALYAVLAGNSMYLLASTWFNVLPDSYLAVTSAFSFSIFATSSFVVGSYVLIGKPGIALAAAFTILVANPISGIALPAIFLPEPWGVIGQGLTMGASGTLVRAAAYFPTAQVLTTPIIVLGIWSLVGIAATVSRDRKAFKT